MIVEVSSEWEESLLSLGSRGGTLTYEMYTVGCFFGSPVQCLCKYANGVLTVQAREFILGYMLVVEGRCAMVWDRHRRPLDSATGVPFAFDSAFIEDF